MKQFDFDEFMHNANSSFILECDTRVSYGQHLFYCLKVEYPEVANALPISYNPYYDNDVVPKFMRYLCSLNQ
jgi:hypothetical protein